MKLNLEPAPKSKKTKMPLRHKVTKIRKALKSKFVFLRNFESLSLRGKKKTCRSGLNLKICNYLQIENKYEQAAVVKDFRDSSK